MKTKKTRAKAPKAARDAAVALFISPEGNIRLDVRIDAETVWLSLLQISALFGRDKSVVSRHLRNVFESGELERSAVVAENATTATDGKVYQVEHFNLDAILSVGYRVNSKRGTQFRIWATTTLRDHLVRGFTHNERRVRERGERGLRDAEQAVALLARTLTHNALITDEGRSVLSIVADYARTWRVLLELRREPSRDEAEETARAHGTPVYRRRAIIS